MKSKVKEMLPRVKALLTDKQYLSCKDLAKHCRLSSASACRVIRLMREQGIGVLTTNKGYTLSKYAKKPDDVNFLRRLHGRRTSDFIALHAAQADIRHRWHSLADQQNLRLIVAPLESNRDVLERGMKVLLSTTNSKGL